MLHIAICDDEQAFVSHLEGLLEKYAEEAGEAVKIETYSDGLELIEKYDATYDLIFLDIQMEMVDGLKAAGHIRQRDKNVSIIFLTTLSQYALEGYKYQATNFIIKPIGYERLKSELTQWQKRRSKEQEQFIVVSNAGEHSKVSLDKLIYIETFGRKLLLHTEQEKIICGSNMKEMEAELKDKGFARCHTSYLVNLKHIKRVSGKDLQVELLTGEKLPISQPKRKNFMMRMAEDWGDML